MENSNFFQRVEMTREEKIKMYSDMKIEEVSEMLVNCNEIIDRINYSIDSNNGEFVPYQKCPVCEGSGSLPQYRPDVNTVEITTTMIYTNMCHVCQGQCIIPMHKKTNP